MNIPFALFPTNSLAKRQQKKKKAGTMSGLDIED
jgi:hypothetical protein